MEPISFYRVVLSRPETMVYGKFFLHSAMPNFVNITWRITLFWRKTEYKWIWGWENEGHWDELRCGEDGEEWWRRKKEEIVFGMYCMSVGTEDFWFCGFIIFRKNLANTMFCFCFHTISSFWTLITQLFCQFILIYNGTNSQLSNSISFYSILSFQ